MISQRGQLLKPSPTLAMANRARELAAQGNDVISLTVGEPDWPTLASAKRGALLAIEAGHTRYTAAQGIPELRKALGPWIKAETGIEYKENEIVVGCGAKYVIAAIFQMILDPGDEVLIPSPYWVSYPTMTELAGGVPRIINCGREAQFKLTPALLEEGITQNTKALVLCSPSNPTGLMYSEEELKALAGVLKKHPEVLVISDDIYNRLTLNVADGTIAPHLLKADPSLRDQVVAVNGASKAFSMTGWRIGWAAGPAELMKLLGDYFSQTTSNTCSVSQYAALAAIQAGSGEVAESVRELRQRCKAGVLALKKVKDLEVVQPQGAFYFWVDVKGWMNRVHAPTGMKLAASADIAEALLDLAHLAVIPGIEFGCEGFLRLSFAVTTSRFGQAAQRLDKFAVQLD